MSDFIKEATDKIRKGVVTGAYSSKANAMKTEVGKALESFCQQEEEFAQAVVQGGTFEACMAKVAAGVGQSISDLEAYRRAVQFYFPGAEIRCEMTVDLIGKAAEEPKRETNGKAVILDLTDFL